MALETAVKVLDDASATGGLPAGTYLVLTVADTGVGIPSEHLGRIFEPFFTTKPEGHGTGLGLATAYGIAKSHGGSLRVYSEVGVGTRFHLYLPALTRPGLPRAEDVRQSPRGSGVVLVVDDEELVRRSAGRILTSLGYQAALVAGGQEALDWLEAQAALPAAVVLDLSMPGMDGPSCFDQMRARYPGLKVVISSGFDRTGRGQDLLDKGAKAFVQKPYGTGELAVAIADAIRGAP
jgi:CheY-like chemotaxis protein